MLDVACGTGAAALRAAARVFPGGHVTGIDLSPAMVALAADKAQQLGVDNATFRQGDMTRIEFSDGTFDAVTCVLGLFFAPDMVAQAAELWRVIKPGGRLAIATLGRDRFSPLEGVFTAAVEAIAPSTPQDYAPARASDPAVVAGVLADAGIPGATVTSETYHLPLSAPGDWWRIILGTGMRRTVMAMGPDASARVRAHNEEWIMSNNVKSIALGFIYATAIKG